MAVLQRTAVRASADRSYLTGTLLQHVAPPPGWRPGGSGAMGDGVRCRAPSGCGSPPWRAPFMPATPATGAPRPFLHARSPAVGQPLWQKVAATAVRALTSTS